MVEDAFVVVVLEGLLVVVEAGFEVVVDDTLFVVVEDDLEVVIDDVLVVVGLGGAVVACRLCNPVSIMTASRFLLPTVIVTFAGG